VSSEKPLLVVVAGPTASGKTAVAIALAKHFGTEILSADSRQCFREMTIGVAKPTDNELSQVRHHFINTHSISQAVDAAAYESYGLGVLNKLFSSRNIVIAAGGTGLYIKALCEGIDAMPAIDDAIRMEVRKLYDREGLQAISTLLKSKDSVYASDGEMQNPQRVMRALEVVMQTGKSIRCFQQGPVGKRFFNTLYLGMDVQKEVLHQRIHDRVDDMMKAGLQEEVKALLPYRTHNALQTVGYKELFNYLEGKISLEQAVEQIKIHTRQYAKRQLTWFRKVEGIHWFSPTDITGMINCIQEHMLNN
jgi:tRNA dimethylallyltransferase